MRRHGVDVRRARTCFRKGARFGYRMGDGKMIDAMIHDGLTNPFSGKHMAQEASPRWPPSWSSHVADMDRWSLRSHELALKATDEGRLPEEIVPITIKGKQGRHGGARWMRHRGGEPTLEALAKLPPIFLKDGTRTPPETLAWRQ